VPAGQSSEIPSLEEIARRFHECSDDVDRHELAGWIHEDAEMSLLMTHFETVRGREAIMDALFSRRESLLYDARVESFEWLDNETVIVQGKARYALSDHGVTQSTVWWLDEFRDGLLRHVEAFVEKAAARHAYMHRRTKVLSAG